MLPNRFGTALDVIADLVVGEADHAIALSFQPRLTLNISELNLFQPLMHAAIHLDHQLLGVAGEVGEVATYRSLPTEVRVQLSYLVPKSLLGARHPALQASGPRSRRRGLPLMLEHQAFPPCWAT